MSSLNQPFLPSLSLSAPELLGRTETQRIPTTMCFAAAFPDLRGQNTSTTATRMPKAVRDIEMALNANWRRVTEVAVLTL